MQEEWRGARIAVLAAAVLALVLLSCLPVIVGQETTCTWTCCDDEGNCVVHEDEPCEGSDGIYDCPCGEDQERVGKCRTRQKTIKEWDRP